MNGATIGALDGLGDGAAVGHAVIAWQDDGTPYAPRFGDIYHARAGALGQARHVFLGGNGLPQRWRAPVPATPAGGAVGDDVGSGFTILENGFGLGNNFLAAWDAWRATPGTTRPLHYIGIEKHPPCLADLQRAHAGSPLADLARALLARWPAPVPGMHCIPLADGAPTLRLVFMDALDAAAALAQSAADGRAAADERVDAFFLDGFAPGRNPDMWSTPLMTALVRLAAPGATAATWSTARTVRDALSVAGFEVAQAPGYAGKREMTVARLPRD